MMAGQCSASVDVVDDGVFVNGVHLATVVDSNQNIWFRGKDVAQSINKSSQYLLKQLSSGDKKTLKSITIHQGSPPLQTDPRNIFINEAGFFLVLLIKDPSTQRDLSAKITSYLLPAVVPVISSDGVRPPTKMKEVQSEGLVTLNTSSIPFVVDATKMGWFPIEDVARALGYPASDAFRACVPVSEKKSPKNSRIGSTMHLEIVSQRGLIFILCAKLQRFVREIQKHGDALQERVVAEKPLSFHCVGNSLADLELHVMNVKNSLVVNGKSVQFVVDSDLSTWFRAVDLAASFNYSNISRHVLKCDKKSFNSFRLHKNFFSVKCDPRNVFINQKGLISLICARWQLPRDEEGTNLGFPGVLQSIFPSFSRSSRSTAAAPFPMQPQPVQQCSIIVQRCGSSEMLFKVSVAEDKANFHQVEWEIPVQGGKHVLYWITHFLNPWKYRSVLTYRITLDKLQALISKISVNFDLTYEFVDELRLQLEKGQYKSPDSTLKKITVVEIFKLVNQVDQSGREEWIYVASSEQYARRNIFKVGSTSRLARRIRGYQTGRLEEDFYHYYKVRRVFESKKIDHMIKCFLDQWSQKRGIFATEMYSLDFVSLCAAIDTIIDLYENTRQYVYAHI